MPASILVAGVYTNLVAFSGDPVTVISSAFVDRVASRHRNNLLALTINGGQLGSFTDVLECSVRRNTEADDISLGLDWMASVALIIPTSYVVLYRPIGLQRRPNPRPRRHPHLRPMFNQLISLSIPRPPDTLSNVLMQSLRDRLHRYV
ncbi:hypothetical protein B0H10DRAFT_2233196 [Mycena sp. CBHHK59/15]|nr:hypothetical protein B0H10DRAFT_2233196 [Mycena sp. CBHHK59/15]